MNTRQLATRTLVQSITATIVFLIAWLVVTNGKILLTFFGGILIAVLFRESASWIGHKTGVKSKFLLPVTIIAPFVLLGLFFAYTAPQISAQGEKLMERIPQGDTYINEHLSGLPWGTQLKENLTNLSSADSEVSTVVNAVSSVFSSTLNGFGSFIFALFLGLFLAVNPDWYIKGAVTLVPPARRERIREVLGACGRALSGWLVAKIASMVLVGILTTLGLWALGTDLALVLGVIAALLSFIPNIGPILGFIPAAMVSVITGLDTLLYVSILYVAVQMIESYVLTPMLQAELADLPPALTLFAQVALGAMVGMAGILLAAPLCVAAMVFINKLYVEDILEKPNENRQTEHEQTN
ncbi:MAG: AI-2E family transporter [Paraglaciecola chathamensis]